MVVTNILIGLYFVIAFIFHLGIYNEWKKDTDPEMKKFNPIFIQIALVGSALLWPVLIVVAIYKPFKKLLGQLLDKIKEKK